MGRRIIKDPVYIIENPNAVIFSSGASAEASHHFEEAGNTTGTHKKVPRATPDYYYSNVTYDAGTYEYTINANGKLLFSGLNAINGDARIYKNGSIVWQSNLNFNSNFMSTSSAFVEVEYGDKIWFTHSGRYDGISNTTQRYFGYELRAFSL